MAYIDTSIIIAALDPYDPRRKEAISLLEKEEFKIVSELTLAELASVLSRRRELISTIADKLKLSKELTIVAILLYLTKRFKLKYMKILARSRIPLIGDIYTPMAKAIMLSSKLGLKALDLLHVAYLEILKEEGTPVTKLLTFDKDFKKAKEYLEKEVKVKVEIR